MIRLYNADCLDILPTLEPGSVDAVVTDPPYGIDLTDHHFGKADRRLRVAGDHSQELGNRVLSGFLGRLPVFSFASPMLPWDGEWDQFLVWDKGLAVGGGGDVRRTWKRTWELVQVSGVTELRGARDGSVLRYPVAPQNMADHPYAKPVDLLVYLIRQATDPGDTILDPFMGSGRVGIACLRTDRNFIGVELDPKHFATAERRIEAERTRHPLFAGASD